MYTNEVVLLETAFKILRFHTYWPQNGKKMTDWDHIIPCFINLVGCSFIGFGGMLHLTHTFATGANYLIDDILEDCSIMLSWFGVIYMVLCHITKISAIKEVMVDLSEFERFGKPPNIDRVNKMMHYLMIGTYAYGTSGVCTLSLYAFWRKGVCEEESAKHNVQRLCGLITPVWLPFHINGARYYMFLIVQFSTLVCGCCSGMIMIAFMFSVMEIFIAKITHLISEISMIFTPSTSGERKQNLRYCMEYYQDILRIADNINLCFGKTSLMFIAFSAVIIGMIGVQFLFAPDLSTLAHLIAWIGLLFGLSLGGQRLMTESSKISNAFYSIPWYEADVPMQKDILFSIMRSNNCIIFNADGFSTICMITFASTMQTAYSYLTLIYQSSKDE